MKKLYTTPSVEVEEMNLISITMVSIPEGSGTAPGVGQAKQSLFENEANDEDNAEY